MSVTRNIQASALFSMPFIGYQPVSISNGEPAITAANLTKQTILGPPFKWPWNRGTFHIDLDPAEDRVGTGLSPLTPRFSFHRKAMAHRPQRQSHRDYQHRKLALRRKRNQAAQLRRDEPAGRRRKRDPPPQCPPR